MAALEGRPAVRKIKIKLGNTVLATQTIRTSGPGSSKDNVQAAGGGAVQGKRNHARSVQATLQGYAPPTASPSTVVALLRLNEGFSKDEELANWDLPTACQLGLLGDGGDASRSTKRAKTASAPDDRQASLPKVAPAPAPDVRPARTASQQQQQLEEQPKHRAAPCGVRADGGQNLPAKREAAHAASKPVQPASNGGMSSDVAVESNSDQGTNSHVCLPASPEHHEAQQGAERVAGPPGPAGTSGRAVPPQLGRPANRTPVPAGPSMGTQTQRSEFPVLPTNFLEVQNLSSIAQAYSSIGPFDLQLERDAPSAVTEHDVAGQIDGAAKTKREGDALCKKNNGIWTIKALSRYVSAALMFMEAAEMMQRQRRESRSADMYRQTADLLVYTAKIAESIRGANEVGREALRLLAERLCAACYMRQAACQSVRYSSCAGKALAALKEHQARGGQAAGAAGRLSGAQPSPEDSTTSSMHPPASGGASSLAPAGGLAHAVPGVGQEQISELLACARVAARCSEYVRRSAKGFETFLERADVRQNQQAKLVCMHLAAICMDMGMTPGMRIIQHAREAVRTLCDDLAR